jgi:hypothetical protein
MSKKGGKRRRWCPGERMTCPLTPRQERRSEAARRRRAARKARKGRKAKGA